MKRLFNIILFQVFCAVIFAQGKLHEFEYKYYSDTSDTLKYRLLKPENIDCKKKYPLVVFLHGAGERGNDNEKQLAIGANMWLNPINREKYPAYVLMPQCPLDDYWAYAVRPKSFVPNEMPILNDGHKLTKLLKGLIDSYLLMDQIDKTRIYIMGLSMGGMGTFDMVIRYPDIFAAAIPICGNVNPTRLSVVKDVKFRIFHGDSDDVVPVEGSRNAYKALKSAGVDVEYIEFAGVNHICWNMAFNYPDFMQWMFSIKRNFDYK